MWTLAAALVAGLASGSFLGRVRRLGGRDSIRPGRRALARAASFAFAISLSSALLHATLFLGGLLGGWVRGPEPVLPVAGAVLGLIGYLHVRVLVLDVARWSFCWAVRAPERLDRTWKMEATSIAWGLVAWPCIGAIVMSAALLFQALSYFIIPAVVAIPLFYEAWLHPWLQYWKSRRLGDTPHEELEDWLAEIAERHGVPRFDVRVHEGLEKNAFAMGGLARHLVVVGGGLVQGMTTGQLKAVLAHEIAHVIRRDALKLVAAVLVGGTCFVTFHVGFVAPNIDTSNTLGHMLRSGVVGICVALFYLVLPGMVSRRLEYGADRLAVRLLDDSAPMIDALVRLHELHNRPLDEKSLTHPTGTQRIAAIRRSGPAVPGPDDDSDHS